jgi:protein-disulfide isomerase
LVSAKQLENEFLSTIPPSNIIEALTLIIDMLYSNPFKVSDYIIVEMKSLQRLIQLLTSADDVIIQTTNDVECGYCGTKNVEAYSMINSIQIKHADIVREFKYTYQEAAMFLKDRHISIKFVFSC